jgi:dihydrofolate synthase / folylpolyglutamate synthase
VKSDERLAMRPTQDALQVLSGERRTLADWLAYQEQLHPNTIDLGLERLSQVLARLQWRQPACPVITVGGTNGKGSCVALLDSILSAGGYRVGTFTSPHLVRYNERIRIAGSDVSDASLVAAFARIEVARGDISLTFFEFNALAALLLFDAAGLDAVVLEVGLGGRLDAVNVVDADVALLSSIALDHCDWLGHDVESIGREKAGIFRAGRAAVFGARTMPASVALEAQRIGAHLLQLGKDFDYRGDATLDWRYGENYLASLPRPALPGAVQLDNAAAVLASLECLRERLPLTRAAVDAGLRAVRLAGRFQSIYAAGQVWLLDVAHNPAAAKTLADNLNALPCHGRTIAVCGMFADKDVAGVIAAVQSQIDVWVAAGVSGARALAPMMLAEQITAAGATVAHTAQHVQLACVFAQSMAQPADRIVVFGSFLTVGPALAWLENVRIASDE